MKNACFTLLGGNQFVWCVILSCDTVALYHRVHGKSLSTVSSFEHWARKMFLLHLLRQVHCHLTQQKNRRDVFAENQAFSILHQAQEGRQELIKQDVGEMLVSIVLDRPLDEAKALVEDRDRLISEITVILESQQANMLNQMVNPDVRDDMLHRSLIEKIRPPRSTTQAEVPQARFQ